MVKLTLCFWKFELWVSNTAWATWRFASAAASSVFREVPGSPRTWATRERGGENAQVSQFLPLIRLTFPSFIYWPLYLEDIIKDPRTKITL